MDTSFLKVPISPTEMPDFCDKALKLLNEWKKPEYEYHPFLYD